MSRIKWSCDGIVEFGKVKFCKAVVDWSREMENCFSVGWS